MIYNIRQIDEDTIFHELIEEDGTIRPLGKQVGISKAENLQESLQDWVDQRKTLFDLSSVTNDFGFELKLE